MHMFKYFNGVLALAAVLGVAWILSLPNKSECTASGRIVEPTERYCEAADGHQLLEEHAWFHTREVAIGGTLLWIGAYFLHRRGKRKTARSITA
jgi:hypothetical protein